MGMNSRLIAYSFLKMFGETSPKPNGKMILEKRIQNGVALVDDNATFLLSVATSWKAVLVRVQWLKQVRDNQKRETMRG